ncbi:hydrogen gas-evolving membrane-bound hydrogenase subunit E [Gracilimonas amylolytica]|uniref:hydrogen gas-evolving membrane-bound hydrogenase subunit E n=1 Tax=Gracilimonas amylolytica TaxID=1749045 RepID=UPI000CD88315|nr:hydrogen gas-evolving membrane-bound hydrogenase subunit E [Gracilimonas amylolytica]
MKVLKLLLILVFALLLLFAASDLPFRGKADNQMNQRTSMTGTEVPGNYYIREAYNDAHTPNIVTVVLGDYRSIDTLGEQIVIFTAGMITFLLLRNRREDDER